jgi:MFS family permease
MIAVLRQRNFALLWFGGLISMIGDWMLVVALPIYVYRLTGSALATSGAGIAWILPGLLLGSIAGVFVDRWDRKRTMAVANLLLALGLLPLLLVRSAESIWIVYAVAFFQSSVRQFFYPAENALLPRLVGEEHLVAANSLNALNNNLARLLGPPLGGVVAVVFSLGGIALADAATFVFAGGMVALISASGRVEKISTEETARVAASSWKALWPEWIEGLKLVKRDRLVSTLFIMMAIMALGEGVFAIMFVVWISRVLGGGAPEYGWLMSAQAVGGLLGGMVAGSIARWLRPVQFLGYGAVVFGLLDLALFNYPLFFSGLWVGLVLIALVGLPSVGAFSNLNTLLQSRVADEYRGRIFGALGTTSALLQLAGTVIAGALGDTVHPILVLSVQGGAYVAAGLFVLARLQERKIVEETALPSPSVSTP